MNRLSPFADLALPELGVKMTDNSRDVVRAYTKAFGKPVHISGSTQAYDAMTGAVQYGHNYKVLCFANGRKLVIWRTSVQFSDGMVNIYKCGGGVQETHQIQPWTVDELTTIHTDLNIFINGTKTDPSVSPAKAQAESFEALIADKKATLERKKAELDRDVKTLERMEALRVEEAAAQAQALEAQARKAQVDADEEAFQELIREHQENRASVEADEERASAELARIASEKADLALV